MPVQTQRKGRESYNHTVHTYTNTHTCKHTHAWTLLPSPAHIAADMNKMQNSREFSGILFRIINVFRTRNQKGGEEQRNKYHAIKSILE